MVKPHEHAAASVMPASNRAPPGKGALRVANADRTTAEPTNLTASFYCAAWASAAGVSTVSVAGVVGPVAGASVVTVSVAGVSTACVFASSI